MDKEFRQYSRTMAEECTKEQLVDLYIAEVETCVEVEEQLAITEKALSLAVKTLHRSQGDYCDYCEDANKRICSPLISNCHRHIVNYFKKQAKEMMKSE